MTEKSVLSEATIELIEQSSSKPYSESYLISVLQQVQNDDGFLSREAMDEVSWRMQIPAAKVTGVATFYHFFSFKPRGKIRITICLGTACYVRGAQDVMERFLSILGTKEGETTSDGLFSVESARCLGACAMAPIILVNERVYGNVKPDDVRGILREHGFKD